MEGDISLQRRSDTFDTVDHDDLFFEASQLDSMTAERYVNTKGPRFVEEPADAGDITFSRRVARWLSRYEWYYPQRDNPDVCLDKGWSHFENAVLPRRFYDYEGIDTDPANDDTKMRMSLGKPSVKKAVRRSFDQFERAPPGRSARPTALYPLSTPEKELADFGIGVGMYFATLRGLILICLLAGIIHIPLVVHFSSTEYGGDIYADDTIKRYGMAYPLKYSAYCSKSSWVPCTNCGEHDGQWIFSKAFYRNTTNVETRASGYIFVKHNQCTPDFEKFGSYSVAAILVIFLVFIFVGKVQEKIEIQFDENDQTCADYSVFIANPPPNIYDASNYKEYFEEITDVHVTSVTIGLDNSSLLKCLIRRRELARSLAWLRTPFHRHSSAIAGDFVKCYVQNKQPLLTFHPKANFWNRWHELRILRRLKKIEKGIKKLLENKFNVVGVYVVFEQEVGQRRALKLCQLKRNANLEEHLPRFCDTDLICQVPPEPNSVLWEQLGSGFFVSCLFSNEHLIPFLTPLFFKDTLEAESSRYCLICCNDYQCRTFSKRTAQV